MPAHGEGRGTGASAKLNTFDVTSLVVGSIIGADVYIATAIGARLVGPSSLFGMDPGGRDGDGDCPLLLLLRHDFAESRRTLRLREGGRRSLPRIPRRLEPPARGAVLPGRLPGRLPPILRGAPSAGRRPRQGPR